MATGIDSETNETCPVFPSGLFGEGAFDPCPLQVLARHMLDGRWVDVRTDEGLICRVRITEIVVRAQGEDIRLRQEWLDGPDDKVRRIRQEIVVDADAIWKVLPTNYHIEQVQPWKTKKTGGPRSPVPDETAQTIVTQVIETALFLYQTTKKDLIEEGNASPRRYVAMLVIFEMTDISVFDICTKHFGYHSPTPMVSAQYRLRSGLEGHRNETFVTPENIRRLADLVDQALEPQAAREGRTERYRSSRVFPNDYTPVLT
jgi:hypothetical protein